MNMQHCRRTYHPLPTKITYNYQCLTQLLDEFLVFVELFECLNIHAWDAIGLGLITVRGITQHTHLELRTRNVTKPRIQHSIMYVSQ